MELKCNIDSVEYCNGIKILTSNVIACAGRFRGLLKKNAVRKHFLTLT